MSKITTHELAKYAADQLDSGVEAPAIARQLAAYLIEERRSRELPAVMRAIDEELSRRGSSQLTITSAHATDLDTKKQLAKLLGISAEKAVFSEVIDKTVIGGVKASSGETEIDLTVRARLNKFKVKVVN
jgi:F0F1-type ATP synthase delta subunit